MPITRLEPAQGFVEIDGQPRLAVELPPPGPAGLPGISAGVQFEFDIGTSDNDPGPGNLRANNASLSSATKLYIDNLDRFGNTVSDWLDSFDDGGGSADRGRIIVSQYNDASAFAMFVVTGGVVSGGGYRKLDVTYVGPATSPTFSDEAALVATFLRSGVAGPASPIDYDTAADFQGAMVDPAATHVRVAGFNAPRDGGGADYRKILALPTNASLRDEETPSPWVQSLDGSLWELAEATVYADMLGAVRGTGTDAAFNCLAIQATIDFCTYFGTVFTGPPSLHFGRYEYSGTLHLGYGHVFAAVALRGQGALYQAAVPGVGTALVHKGPTTDPALNFQGVRRGRFKGITLMGLFYEDFVDLTFSYAKDAILEATWTAVGGDSDTAMYAGATLDAYAGTRPGTSFSDVNYPAFTGLATQWGRLNSSDILFEDFELIGFNTGFVTKPSGGAGSDANGDFITFRDGSILYNKYGVSITHTQARNNRFENILFAGLWSFITTKRHGLKNGRLDGYFTGCSGGQLQNLMEINLTDVCGYTSWHNCYAEAMYSFGDTGTSGSTAGRLDFFNCQFNFSLQGPVLLDERPGYILRGTHTGRVNFHGGIIAGFPSAISFQPQGCAFHGTQMVATERVSTVTPRAAMFHNATCGGVVTTKSALRKSAALKAIRYNVSTGAVVGGFTADNDAGYFDGNRDTCIPQHIWHFGPTAENEGPLHQKAHSVKSILKSSLSSLSYNAATKTLTLVFASLSDAESLINGPANGDHLLDLPTGTVFIVRSRTGATVLATAENNIDADTGEFLVNVDTVGGMECFNNRLYTLQYSLRGNFTAASPNATGCARPDGFSAFMSDLVVGDALVDDPLGRERVIASTNGIIDAYDATAQTINFSGAASLAQTRHLMDLWIRQGPANA